jgi:hypothetical protein
MKGYGKNYANGHGSEDTITVPRAVASLTGVRIFDACGGADFMAVLTTKGEFRSKVRFILTEFSK